MQSLRSTFSPLKCPSTRTTYMLPARPRLSTQRLSHRLDPPSIYSTPFIRRASWLPLQRANIKVQHVKLLQRKGRFFQNKWLQRILIWLLVMRVMGLLFGKKPGDAADTTKTPRETSLEIQDQANSADEDPSPQAADEDEVSLTIDPDNAWFLPLTWPRRKPPIPYKASDEEWQEFCKLSQDLERQLAVKGQAVDYVHYIAKHHPQVKKILGRTSTRSRYWLDIDYPMKYDEGYESTGIVITDDFIALAARDYDDSTVDHFRHVVSGLPVISALWNVSKALFTGGETLTTSVKKNDKLPVALPGVPDLSGTPELAKVLRTSVRQLQTRPRSIKSVPRGCVMVSGRVDVQGTKAWAQFSIVGYYNPQKDAWAALPIIGLGPVRPMTLKPVG